MLPGSMLDKVLLDDNGCWLWTASKDRGGYGRVRIAGRLLKAHRAAYEQLIGPIPEGMTIDHLCRVRACVNPHHVEVVTRGENVLRGNGFSGTHARMTHCVRGHPLSGDNLYVTKQGQRHCRTCHCLRQRARYWRNKGHGKA